jgi:hypothetical protein
VAKFGVIKNATEDVSVRGCIGRGVFAEREAGSSTFRHYRDGWSGRIRLESHVTTDCHDEGEDHDDYNFVLLPALVIC